jgi:hypothetical protein
LLSYILFNLFFYLLLHLRGCKHLVVCSRSGVGDSSRQAIFKFLREKYEAEIVVESCDSSSSSQTRALLEKIRNDMPPLRGIIHGAMVLYVDC